MNEAKNKEKPVYGCKFVANQKYKNRISLIIN